MARGWGERARTIVVAIAAVGLAGAMTLDWLPRTLRLEDLGPGFDYDVSAWGAPWHEVTVPLLLALTALVIAALRKDVRRAAALVLAAVTVCVASVVVRALAAGDGELIAGPALGAVALALAVTALEGPRGTRAELAATALAAVLLVVTAQHRYGWTEDTESVYVLRGYGASVYSGVYSAGEAWRSASAVAGLVGAMAGLGVVAARAVGPRCWFRQVRTIGIAICLGALGFAAIGLAAWSSDPDDVLDRMPGALLVLGPLVAMAAALTRLPSPTHDRP